MLGGIIGAGAISFGFSMPVAAAYTDAENSYIQQVQGAGVVGDPGKIVETAHAVCRHTDEGASVDDMATTLAEGSTNVNGSSAITIDQAYGMVRTAQSTVCAPQGETAPVDCTKLRDAYDSIGPVINGADAAEKINRLRIPGVSQVTAVSLGLCGIDAIPAAINNPTPDNQQRVFDGGCGFVNQFTNGIIDVCGDTPVGSD